MEDMNNIFDSFPENARKAIMDRLQEADGTGEYEYSDNYRYARVTNEQEMEQYEEAVRCGCCGYFDEEIEVDGVTYVFGFNYGH